MNKLFFRKVLAFWTLFSVLIYSFWVGIFMPNSYSADGSAGDPFTSLHEAHGESSWVYNFNIGWNSFSTYVDADGWILVASCEPASQLRRVW